MAIGDTVPVTLSINFAGNSEADLGKRQARIARKLAQHILATFTDEGEITMVVTGQPSLIWQGARSHYPKRKGTA